MTTETVSLTIANMNTVRTIVAGGQAVGFTVTEMLQHAPTLTIGKSYTFDKLDGDGDLTFKDDDDNTAYVSERNLKHFSIALHASQEDLDLHHDEAQQKQKADVAEKLHALRAKVDVFLSDSEKHACGLKVGNAIEWKEGMKHKKVPAYGQPVVVVEVLDEPSQFKGETGTPYYADKNDIVIATVDGDGDLVTYVMDSRRFKLFKA